MKLIVFKIIITFGLIFSETDLLRSKYLTNDMINNLEKLGKYKRKAKIIFDDYEKAKFYQYVAFVYYEKYLELVDELNSLDKHFYYVFTNYKSEKIYYEIEQSVNPPGIQNDFYPILFDENSDIEIKLFQAKADMFEKQYREYLIYFNEKNKIYLNKLGKIKKNISHNNKVIDKSKFFENYKAFIANLENIDYDDVNSLEVKYKNDLVSEISFEGKYLNSREFYYEENSKNLLKTIDIKDGKIILQTDYNINLNHVEFFNYIKNEFYEDIDLDKYGCFSKSFYNEFGKVVEITYFSPNKNIIGIISREFQQDFLKLNIENWYLGDNERIVRSFKNTFNPQLNENILIEEKYKLIGNNYETFFE